MQSIKISNILLPFPPPHLFPLLMLSFQELKYTLPGLRPFSHPRPRALVVVIVILLPSSLSPSSYLPLSPSATSWNQMQQSQKNLKYIAIMQKCIHKSFDGGF